VLPVNETLPVAADTLDDIPVAVKVTVPLAVKLADPTAVIEAMPPGIVVGAATVTVPLKPLAKFTLTESVPGKALYNCAVVDGMLMVKGAAVE
jgi:hypothetical protein